ncbi:FAD-dependent oxidoreductase [Paracoccus liaowanqingii]|nr:FAD-dependent oxidoreductase [Paracoccus liaowanqingii]
MEVALRFASRPPVNFAPGDAVYGISDCEAPMWLVLDGTIDVLRRDGLNRKAPITSYSKGQFSGEVNQVAGLPAIAAGRAGLQGCTALPFEPHHLRALMVGSAELGEIIMRALILRRVDLIDQGGSGTVLIGHPDNADLLRLQGFLTRSGLPNQVLDVSVDNKARALVARTGVLPDELPLVVCPDGQLLRRPENVELAACLGILPDLTIDRLFNVVIVGAGPAGLAAAVYAASEGLSVLVLDEASIGGQAGASARIENYLGFPTGISGQALSGRAFNQALKFGAEIAVPVSVEHLEVVSDTLHLTCSGGYKVRATTVVIASGARYRRPDVENLDLFEGVGVSYWASAIEARLCAGRDVALIGGGNSAGQAVVYLASHVAHLDLIVRRPLEETMSRYLVDRIAALPNVKIHIGLELHALDGNSATGLSGATFRNLLDGATCHRALCHMFVFIGAEPNAGWADSLVEINNKGFIVTGAGTLPLETSMSGVFAIGDVRAGSTKRVAAAVGEGAAVVAQIHSALARSC